MKTSETNIHKNEVIIASNLDEWIYLCGKCSIGSSLNRHCGNKNTYYHYMITYPEGIAVSLTNDSYCGLEYWKRQKVNIISFDTACDKYNWKPDFQIQKIKVKSSKNMTKEEYAELEKSKSANKGIIKPIHCTTEEQWRYICSLCNPSYAMYREVDNFYSNLETYPEGVAILVSDNSFCGLNYWKQNGETVISFEQARKEYDLKPDFKKEDEPIVYKPIHCINFEQYKYVCSKCNPKYSIYNSTEKKFNTYQKNYPEGIAISISDSSYCGLNYWKENGETVISFEQACKEYGWNECDFDAPKIVKPFVDRDTFKNERIQVLKDRNVSILAEIKRIGEESKYPVPVVLIEEYNSNLADIDRLENRDLPF